MGAIDVFRTKSAMIMRRLTGFIAVCAAVLSAVALSAAARPLVPTRSPMLDVHTARIAPLPGYGPTTAVSPAGDSATTVIIPLAAACKWAYPGQATGQTFGSGFSIVCLDKNGHSLGGFGGRHSLNAWCDDPRHTGGMYLPNPAPVGGIWLCDILSNIPGHLGGYSVAISGSTAVVGLPGFNNSAGAAYVYTGSRGQWHQTTTLTDPRNTNNDQFGWSVATAASSTGSYIAIGGGDSSGQRGWVYVYKESGGRWHRQAALRDPAKNGPSTFGASVAISSSLLVVSAANLASNRGTVYVFRHGASSWILQARLTSPARQYNDFFGESIAIADQRTILVGAYDVAYVYAHLAGRGWVRTARLRNPSAATDNFGWAVATSGRTAVVTAPGFLGSTGTPGAGIAYVYSHIGASWSRVQMLKVPGSNRDAFGASIAMTNERMIIGAPLYGRVACGRAYEFKRIGAKWILGETVVDPRCPANAFFGFSVAILQTTALFGAPYSNGTNGIVFVLYPLP